MATRSNPNSLVMALLALLCILTAPAIHGKPVSPNGKALFGGGSIGASESERQNLPVYRSSAKFDQPEEIDTTFVRRMLESADAAKGDVRVGESPYGNQPPPGFDHIPKPIGTVGDLRNRRRLNIFLPQERDDVEIGSLVSSVVGRFGALCAGTLVYQPGTIVTSAWHCLDLDDTGNLLPSNWNKTFHAGFHIKDGVAVELGVSTPQRIVYDLKKNFAIIRLVHRLDGTLGRLGVDWRPADYYSKKNRKVKCAMVNYHADRCSRETCIAQLGRGKTRGVDTSFPNNPQIRHDVDTSMQDTRGASLLSWPGNNKCCPMQIGLASGYLVPKKPTSEVYKQYANKVANLASPSLNWEIGMYQARLANVHATVEYQGLFGAFHTGGAARCPEGTLANSFKQRVQKGGDDKTFLNSVAVSCRSAAQSASPFVSTTWGMWGSWANSNSCPAGHYAQCFRIKRDVAHQVDYFGAVAVEMRCTNGAILKADNEVANWGTWTEWKCCPAGTAFCGVNIQFDSDMAEDHTAMNGIRLECCP